MDKYKVWFIIDAITEIKVIHWPLCRDSQDNTMSQ